MSSRRNRDGVSPVTLFSFQDIITSLTGIMIFLVLLMAMDVLSQKEAAESTDRAASLPPAPDEAELRWWQSRIAELRRLAAAKGADVEVGSGLDWARQFLAEDASLARLEAERDRLTAEARACETAHAENTAALASLDRELAAYQVALAAASKQLEAEKADQRIRLVVAGSSTKTPWIVECSGASIRIRRLVEAGGTKPEGPRTFESPERSLDAFLAFAAARPRDSEFFVLLIKPSAIGYFAELRARLIDQGVGLGWDALNEDAVTGI